MIHDTYIEFSLNPLFPSNWVSWSNQNLTLLETIEKIKKLKINGYRPVVEIDLDLTSLISPNKCVSVLQSIENKVDELKNVLSQSVSEMELNSLLSTLKRIWNDPTLAETLLPSYTDGGIHGYSLYLTAVLQKKCGIKLNKTFQDSLSNWIYSTVYKVLRNGYWDRNLKNDNTVPGFEVFVSKIIKAGGEIIFISNRSPEMREDSIFVLNKFLSRVTEIVGFSMTPLFAYFGPGGSKYDAVSKKSAQKHIESNPIPQIYLGDLVDSEVVYTNPLTYEGEIVIVSIFDDRAESRKIMIDAASKSNIILKKNECNEIISVGIATIGFTPELSIIDSFHKIASFEHSF